MALFTTGDNGVSVQPNVGIVNGAVAFGHITADAEL